MPRIQLALVLTLALTSAACLRSTTTIDLHPDGSGTIVQETGVSTQTLAMLKQLSANNPGATTPELFSEDQARKAAASMGVTFVSGEPIKTADVEGYRARFSFDDISKVKVNMEQGAPGLSGSDPKEPPFAFTFDRGAASSVLTIQMPTQMPGGGALPGMPKKTG